MYSKSRFPLPILKKVLQVIIPHFKLSKTM